MKPTELSWFKSSYSGSDGDACIEVALSWHKSTHSSGSEGDCVEVAMRPEIVHVRDTKDRHGPILTLPAPAWADFVAYASRA